MSVFKRTTSFSEKRDTNSELTNAIERRKYLENKKVKFNDKIEVINLNNQELYLEHIKTPNQKEIEMKIINIYNTVVYPFVNGLNNLDITKFRTKIYTNILLESELEKENYVEIARERFITLLEKLIESSKLYTYALIGSKQIPLYIIRPVIINCKITWQSFPNLKITKNLEKLLQIII